MRKSPKPLNGTCTTRAPRFFGDRGVPSVLCESTTTISSAHNTVSTAALIFSASL